MPDLQTIHSSSLHFFRLPEDKARLAKTRSNVAIVQLSARPPHYVLQVGFPYNFPDNFAACPR